MASLRALMTAALAATATALPGPLMPSPASTSSTLTHTLTPTPSSISFSTPDASGFSFTPAPSDQHTCGPPSFHATSDPDPGPDPNPDPDHPSSRPALPPASWRHCAALFSSWASRRGTFAVHDGGDGGGNGTVMIPLLAGRGCVLGVRAVGGDGGNKGNEGNKGSTGDEGRKGSTGDEGKKGSGEWLMVGDADVKGIMRTALDEWSRGSELEVQGEVVCEADGGGTGGLWWQIYGDEGR